MRVSDPLSRPLFKFHKRTKAIWKYLEFPFNKLHEETSYYKKVKELLGTKIGCSLENLPGHQPFSAAKRYLRMVAPTLWEESERFEAEVRMIGAMFLAALYSSLLSLIVFILQIIGIFQSSNIMSTCLWAALSILASSILAEGFNHLRDHEVGYTYVNTLIASAYQESVTQVIQGVREIKNEEK